MEHPASKYHPHHLEGSRVFPAEAEEAEVPDQFCFFFSLGNKLLGHFCPLFLFDKSQRRTKLCQSLGQSQLWLWHRQLQVPLWGAADGTRALALPQIPRCCPGATAAPPQHPGPLQVLPKEDAMGSSGKERPQGYCQVLTTSPVLTSNRTTQHTPSYSDHFIKNTTQRTHSDHFKYS